ncbi:haloacid dehalogenase [Mycolicibacterium anyangense]|uniref:Haloacid dehalogenase n=1 Tax=Mycolicibacterium anyangense TaxID=1431246 RepID=A0A6N4WDK2_9MYCO|nr:HAD family hydrolase [Mycolicibacterium anyangense]BBZ78473.1 haloacid dehalogenase [Mycolicibacterium anyangense]
MASGDFAAGRPEMVVLDIDGTLHAASDTHRGAHQGISVAVRAAVRAVAESGAHVVLCTGRLSAATLPFLQELEMSAGFAVCSNGAVLIDAATGRVIEQVSFSLSVPIAHLRERLPGAVFVAEDPGVGVWATGLVDDADTHYGAVTLVEIDDLVAASTTRLAVHWPGHRGCELADALSNKAIPYVECCCYPDEPLADLTSAGVTKAAMLERLRVQLRVAASETLAVGDGVNDMEMLAWAAHGVAMGNSPASVQAVADEVCPSAADDGLATLLARWFR